MAFQFPAAPTVGQVFTPSAGINYKWNGSNWEPFKYGGDLGAVAIFTASGNFQSVLGAKYKITVVGGGGGGQSGGQTNDPRSAGAGGGAAIKWWTGDGTLVAVTVGAGGAADQPGAASSFGAIAVASGGEQGVDAGASGGIGTAGDLLIGGQAGMGRSNAPSGYTQRVIGGSSILGGGGKDGAAGRPFGGGGGGSNSGGTAGAGAPGVVIVETVG
jgi:hypothetical protein